MDRSREIEILKRTAESLGADSYCGPWLTEAIPFIESAIKADMNPECWIKLPHQAYAEGKQIVQDAKDEAKKIESRASLEAEKVRDAAFCERDMIMARTRDMLQTLAAKC